MNIPKYKGITRDPLLVILLTFLTCGLYLIYWFYVTSIDINQCLGENRMDPLFLTIFTVITCGLAFLYWLYLMDNALLELGQREQVPYTSNFVLWVILALLGFGGIVPAFQTQTFMNELWKRRS